MKMNFKKKNENRYQYHDCPIDKRNEEMNSKSVKVLRQHTSMNIVKEKRNKRRFGI